MIMIIMKTAVKHTKLHKWKHNINYITIQLYILTCILHYMWECPQRKGDVMKKRGWGCEGEGRKRIELSGNTCSADRRSDWERRNELKLLCLRFLFREECFSHSSLFWSGSSSPSSNAGMSSLGDTGIQVQLILDILKAETDFALNDPPTHTCRVVKHGSNQ